MELFSDYHSHPLAHDPHRRYSAEIIQEWIDSARAAGIRDLAFTDHDRFCAGIDIDLVKRSRDACAGALELKMGVELDNDPESSLAGRAWTERNYDSLDFVLGSIHFIDQWPFDHPDHREEFERRDVDQVYEEYYRLIQGIAADGIFDALAHLDLIKIFGYFPQREQSGLMRETLEIMKKSNLAMEASTAGWHKPVAVQYPSIEILKMAVELGIPITTASDAHHPSHVGRDFDRLGQILDEAGVREVVTFDRHRMIVHSVV